jgi:hypothetical protein
VGHQVHREEEEGLLQVVVVGVERHRLVVVVEEEGLRLAEEEVEEHHRLVGEEVGVDRHRAQEGVGALLRREQRLLQAPEALQVVLVLLRRQLQGRERQSGAQT